MDPTDRSGDGAPSASPAPQRPMLGPGRAARAVQAWGASLAFTIAYFAAGLLGRLTAPDHGPVVLVAPAAGVAVVWLLTSRRRAVDLTLLVAAAGCYHVLTLSDRSSVPLHMGVALVQTLVAVALLRRSLHGPDPHRSERVAVSTGMVWRSVLALVVASSAGATVLVLGLATGVAPELDDLSTWLSYVGRNVTSMTVVVMLAHLFVTRDAGGFWTPVSVSERVTFADAVLVTAVTTVVYVTVFVVSELPLAFLTMLVTLWVASRSTPLVAALHATASGAGATIMTTLGYGPLRRVEDPASQAGVTQMLVFALFVTALVVAAERRQESVTADQLRQEQRRAEDQSAVLTTVLDSLSEAVLVLGADGRVTVANRPGRRWLAMRQEVVRRTGSLTLHDKDGVPVDPAELPSARARRGEDVTGVDLGFRDAAGELHVHAVTAVPLRTGDPEAAAVVVHRDVTEVRAQQDRLSAFAGIVAHDLKNPLASISMWAELLDIELADHHCSGGAPGVPEAVEPMRGITRASRRMTLLIDRLLTQARSESTVLQSGVVDLEAVVGRVAAERRLEGVVTVAGPLPLVRADEMLVTQLLDNLIGNAAKYVAAGVTPRISLTAVIEGEEVEVRVTDNGIGIPAAERPRVFEEFHRSHAEDYEGTGLGLAICRVIVERHGGRIDVVDAPSGTGSCFRFTLPAATPARS